MRILLHIGMHKTGTTALQQYLHRNRPSLLEKHVFYPEARSLDRHSLLAVPMLGGNLPREFWPTYGRDFTAAATAADVIWRKVVTACKEYAPEMLVLSGETFFDIDDFDGLQTRLAALRPSSVQIACYLRDPFDRYPSALQQIVKASTKLPPSLYKPAAGQLEKFRRIGDVHLQEYKKSALEGGDIITDFFSRFLNMTVEAPARGANEGLTAEGAFLIQKFRRQNFAKQDGVFSAAGTQTVAAIKKAERNLGGRGFFGEAKVTSDVAMGICYASKTDLAALEDLFGFRFQNQNWHHVAGAPFDYRRNMKVSDVLNVDKAKLALLAAEVARILDDAKRADP